MDKNELEIALKKDNSFFSNIDFSLTDIGDGNINKVYRAETDNGSSFIIKLAQKTSNISDSIQLNISRGKTESDYLYFAEQTVPGRVPHLYLYSNEHRYIVMQDMGCSYHVLHNEIVEGKSLGFLAQQLASYIAEMCFAFSDFSLSSSKKKKLQKRFVNPKLCKLTEDLVFTEPYFDCTNNSFSSKSEKFVKEKIYSNRDINAKSAEMKYRFMNCPQTLIHGDLHFGSVFISDEDIVVFDPEFCFFGPIGYDLGNLFAHYIMHYIYSTTAGHNRSSNFDLWLINSASEMIHCFTERFSFLAEKCKEPSFGTKEFVNEFISSVLSDTAGFAATECIRRIVGLAKVSVFRFADDDKKNHYETRVLEAAIELLLNKDRFRTADEFGNYLNTI